MIAVDSNVIVRIIVDDDADQVKRSRALFLNGIVLVSNSVFLEAEWILRSVYKYRAVDIAKAFKALIGVDTVVSENANLIAKALAAYENGMDFADALHLASAAKCEAFATFDRALKKQARKCDDFVSVIVP